MLGVEAYEGLTHQQTAAGGPALPASRRVDLPMQAMLKRALDIARRRRACCCWRLPVFLVLAAAGAAGWRPGLLCA